MHLQATQTALVVTNASIAAATSRLASDRRQLTQDAIKSYLYDSSSTGIATMFSSPSSDAEVRGTYTQIVVGNVHRDVARVEESQHRLAATQATLVAQQHDQAAEQQQAQQAEAAAQATANQSQATLDQVKGTLAAEIAQQAAAQAAQAAQAAAAAQAASNQAKAQTAANQAVSGRASGQPSRWADGGVNATTAANAISQRQAAGVGRRLGLLTRLLRGAPPPRPALAAVNAALSYFGVPVRLGRRQPCRSRLFRSGHAGLGAGRRVPGALGRRPVRPVEARHLPPSSRATSSSTTSTAPASTTWSCTSAPP